MKYYKYIYYLYIAIAGLFLYDGIVKLNFGEGNPWISFIFVVLALFMFFFRRKNIQNLEDKNKSKEK